MDIDIVLNISTKGTFFIVVTNIIKNKSKKKQTWVGWTKWVIINTIKMNWSYIIMGGWDKINKINADKYYEIIQAFNSIVSINIYYFESYYYLWKLIMGFVVIKWILII